MEQKTLDITVISAKDLKDVNLVNKMDVYAVVSISGDSKFKQETKTGVDRAGGTHPTWNFPLKFTINESLAQQNHLTLVFELRCERSLGDKEIGKVIIPIKELLESTNGDEKSMKFVSYQVRKPSGKAKGELNFSYRFGDKVVGESLVVNTFKVDEPVTLYPAVGSSVPPQNVDYYQPPPAGGYVHPPRAPGYAAYPPPPQNAPGSYNGYPARAPPPPGYGYRPEHGYPPPLGHGYPPPPGHGYPPPPRYQPVPGYGYPPAPGYG